MFWVSYLVIKFPEVELNQLSVNDHLYLMEFFENQQEEITGARSVDDCVCICKCCAWARFNSCANCVPSSSYFWRIYTASQFAFFRCSNPFPKLHLLKNLPKISNVIDFQFYDTYIIWININFIYLTSYRWVWIRYFEILIKYFTVCEQT